MLNKAVFILVVLSCFQVFGETLTSEEKAFSKIIDKSAASNKFLLLNKKEQKLFNSIAQKREKNRFLNEAKKLLKDLKTPEKILNDIPTAYWFRDFLYSSYLTNNQVADIMFQLEVSLNDYLPVSGSEKVMQRVSKLRAQNSGFSSKNQKKVDEVFYSLSKERQDFWLKEIQRSQKDRLQRIKNDPKLVRERIQKASELAKKQRTADIAMCKSYKKAIKMNKRYNEISGFKKSSIYIDKFSQKQKTTCRKYK